MRQKKIFFGWGMHRNLFWLSDAQWERIEPHRSRVGRNTKIHALADAKGRLLAIMLTGGEAHDCPVAERLIRRGKTSKYHIGDKAYDSAELRVQLQDLGTKLVIPNRSSRKQTFSFNKRLRKARSLIENAFSRLSVRPGSS